jgi:hypothetical protein
MKILNFIKRHASFSGEATLSLTREDDIFEEGNLLL